MAVSWFWQPELAVRMSGRGSSRESSQPGGAACRQAGRWRRGEWGTCLGSSDTASLNWCFENRNVSSFGTCFVCLCFQRTSRLSSRSSCNSLENAKTCTQVCRRLKPFRLNVALCSRARCFCLHREAECNGACPYICLLYSPPVLLWVWVVSVVQKS